MTTQREQFEAWAHKKYGRHLPTERDEHGYFDLRTDAAWLAWCASADTTREECAKVCDEIRKGLASMRDDALSAGDSTMAAVHNGSAIVIRELASELRALGTQSGKEG